MTDNQILAGAERQAQLEAAKAAFFTSGGRVTQFSGFERPLLAARSERVDPETVLKRRRTKPTNGERTVLRKLAEAL